MASKKELIDYLGRTLEQLDEEQRIEERLICLSEKLSSLEDGVKRLSILVEAKEIKSIAENLCNATERANSLLKNLEDVASMMQQINNAGRSSWVSVESILAGLKQRMEDMMPYRLSDAKRNPDDPIVHAEIKVIREIYEAIVDEIYPTKKAQQKKILR